MTAPCRDWMEQVALYVYIGGTLATLAFAALHSLATS